MFSYIGGKSRQAKWISSLIPDGLTRYVEVFGGAMWVYINGTVRCEEAYYNDVNSFLTNVFQCFTKPDKMLEAMDKYEPKDRKLFEKLLQDFKDKEGTEASYDFDMAARYVYCITHSFSGLLSGYSNQEKSRYSKYGATMNRLRNPDIRNKLSKLKVTNYSFDKVLEELDCEGGYFYLDPPYYGKEKYYKFHKFGLEHHKKLAEMMKSGLQSMWSLSYYYFDELEKWFPKDKYKWEIKEFNRSASAKAGKSTKALAPGEELLIMNYDPDDEERFDVLENVDLFFGD